MGILRQFAQDLLEEHRRQRRGPPSWWNLAALWIVPVVLVGSIFTSRKDAAIAHRQRTTIATITSHDPPNHNRYGYAFTSSGKTFLGWAYPGARQLWIGEHVAIYYDPSDPATNSETDFNVQSAGDLFFVPIAVVVAVIVPSVIFLQRRAWKRPRSTNATQAANSN